MQLLRVTARCNDRIRRIGRIGRLVGLTGVLALLFGANPTPVVAQLGPDVSNSGHTSRTTTDSDSGTGQEDPDLHLSEGLELYQQGAVEAAGARWLEAANGFEAAGDPRRQTAALNRAAQARAALGFTQEAAALFLRALAAAPDESHALRAAILGAMARNLLDLGHPSAASEALDQGLAEARGAQARAIEARLLHSRGELLSQGGELASAIDAHKASRRLALDTGDALLASEAGASLARAAVESGDMALAASTLALTLDEAKSLPASDTTARTLIHLGSSFEQLAEARASAAPPESVESGESAEGEAVRSGQSAVNHAAAAYRAALQMANAVGSNRSKSYALGHLGALEESHGELGKAVQLSERAIAAAQPLAEPELSYRWQWQLARLQRARGDEEAALVAYRRAVEALNGLRAANAANGLDFDSEIEPVYFGMVDLLLRRAAATKEPAREQLLTEARAELEELKYAELTEYFQDACVAPEARTSAAAIPGAVVIYPVILPDRTELLLSRTGRLSSVIVPVTADVLNDKVRGFREALPLRSSRAYRRMAADLYDLLIRPIEGEILTPEIETLVFVPGGSLRTIPMSALYDREERVFLIEKRPIAVIPALSLTEPRSLDREKVNTLRAGLTEAVQGFSALEAVGSELEAVQQSFGGRSLVDAEFVTSAMESTMSEESFGIVHIATHGQFSARSADSFLLTYNGKIALEKLGELVERTRYQEEPIELLTLSACETAVGDDRAALGLAGVAVRAGARSALATLWTVNDQASADLIAEFYRQLALPGMSKAQALQKAQLSLLETRTYRHPGYWAAFLMISNWM
jgi:CHAT domain-containing protein